MAEPVPGAAWLPKPFDGTMLTVAVELARQGTETASR
jgi:hypothetical protein